VAEHDEWRQLILVAHELTLLGVGQCLGSFRFNGSDGAPVEGAVVVGYRRPLSVVLVRGHMAEMVRDFCGSRMHLALWHRAGLFRGPMERACRGR